MILGAGLVLAAGILLIAQSSPAPDIHGSPQSVLGSAESEIRSLAENLDSAIKVCTEESARASAGRKEIGSVEKRATSAGMLEWVANPPAALEDQAEGHSARFGRWADPHAVIWIIAFEKRPSCRILVGGSPWASRVRPILYTKIQDDRFWISDGPEASAGPDLTHAMFHADLPDVPNVKSMITVVAPVNPIADAMQLSIGVHLIKKEGK